MTFTVAKLGDGVRDEGTSRSQGQATMIKSGLSITTIVAFLTGPAVVQGQQHDSALRTVRKGFDIWIDFYERDSKAWRVGSVLEQCGYPLPSALFQNLTEVIGEITKRIGPQSEPGLPFQITMLVIGAQTGYRTGWSEALKVADSALGGSGRPSAEACREARETAEDILALRQLQQSK